MPLLPFKQNQDRRRHIPKQRHKLKNWRAYHASLRQRGSLAVWFTNEAIEAWRAEPRTSLDGQPWYSGIPKRLLLGSGVVVSSSRNQGGDECAQQGFAATSRVVHELEEAEIKGQLVL